MFNADATLRPLPEAALRRAPGAMLEALRTTSDRWVAVASAPKAYIIVDPVIALAVLRDGQHFQKASAVRRFRYLAGDGTAPLRLPRPDDPLAPFANLRAWRQQKRATLQIAFLEQNSERQSSITPLVVQRRMAQWRDGGIVDLEAEARAMAIESFIRCFAPSLPAEHFVAVVAQLHQTRAALDTAVRSRIRPSCERDYSIETELHEMLFLFDPITRAVRRRRRALARLLSDALRAPGDDTSLFVRLRRASQAEHAQMTWHDLVGSAVGLFLAGWDNTATTVSWLLWQLAGSSALQETCAAESNRAQLRLAVYETLRMYPPVWSIVRQATSDAAIGDLHIAANEVVVVAPWLLHYSVASWSDPTVFRPARFSAGEVPSAFIPFGAGERSCQGRSFATSQVLLIARAILRQWRLSPAGPAPTPALGVAQHMSAPALATIHARRE